MNFEHVKVAGEKLREINWLYADVEGSSIDDTSRRVNLTSLIIQLLHVHTVRTCN